MIAMVASDGGYSSALVVSSIGTILGAVILLCIQSNQPHVSAATAPAR
jgi:hypothetical protein